MHSARPFLSLSALHVNDLLLFFESGQKELLSGSRHREREMILLTVKYPELRGGIMATNGWRVVSLLCSYYSRT